MNFQITNLRDELSNNKIDEIYLSKVFKIYRELTDAPNISYINLKNIILSLPKQHNIYVYKHNNEPVGLITLIIEQKLIHAGGRVGHIEDLAVDKNYRNIGIATKLISYCINISQQEGCYKVILDCNKELEQFYKKNNFSQTGYFMTLKII